MDVDHEASGGLDPAWSVEKAAVASVVLVSLDAVRSLGMGGLLAKGRFRGQSPWQAKLAIDSQASRV